MAKKKKDKEEGISSIKTELENLGCRIMNSLDDLMPDKFVETGLFGFDRIISDCGGFPGNSVVEIFGPNSTGKSSLALQIAAQAQKIGMPIFYINSERAINSSIVKCFPKLDPNKVDWIEPDTGEAAIDIMKTILKTQPGSLVINDSIPACLPSVMADASASESSVGRLAALFAPFMPEAKKWCRENNSLLIQLNQERAKIGPMARGGTSQPGGTAIKFYSDIRIKLVKKFQNGDIKTGGEQIGHIIEAKTIKTRWAAPNQVAELPLIYGSGFDTARELIACATLYGVVVKKGAWYSYTPTDEKQEPFKCQGEERIASWISQNPEMKKEIRKRIGETIQ